MANDLRRGSLRPEDVICLVVDEAHRATGAYAYCVVVRLLMRFNPHFRILALTATPGSDPERVQGVIDNLHIGHIEVRTEESMDITPYSKNKEIILEKIPLTPELISIRDKWGKLMLPLIKQCQSLFHGSKDPAYIHAFSITSAQMQLSNQRSYLRPNLAVLSKMAIAMAKLLEYSISLAYEKMLELKQESSKCAAGVCSQVGYKSLMSEIGQLITSPGFTPHPKMQKMKALTIEFFVNAQDQGKISRVMIFCHFRDMVTDIVCYLNQESPLIKASAFIGQSNDVRGNRGMNQKTQNEVIQRFKNNEFNVLVATSIGEEGLDIGALDFIICYEAQKSPLRMLQRLGRTGRNEDGKVIVLIAEGREDKNWEKAQDQYQHVQNALLSQRVLELYGDCERLVPEGVRPVPVEQTIDLQPYLADQVEIDGTTPGRKNKGKSTKRKRPGVEDIPAGALLGFVSAKDYQVPKSKSEVIRDRAQAALLSAEEAATLKQQWSRCMSSTVQPPIDPKNMDIHFCSTNSPLGSRLEAIPPEKRSGLNITPSLKYSNVMKQFDLFVEDDAKYEAWRAEKIARLDAKNVIWWPQELRGTGARRPWKLCAEGSRSIVYSWIDDHFFAAPVASTSHNHQSPSNPASSRSSPAPESIHPVFSPDRSNGVPDTAVTLSSPDELPEIHTFMAPPHLMTKFSKPSPPSSPSCPISVNKFVPPVRPAHEELQSSSPVVPLGALGPASGSTTGHGIASPKVKKANHSSGFKRLAAFKSSVLEPAPFVPTSNLDICAPRKPTSASITKPLEPQEKQNGAHLPSSDGSFHEPIPDSEPEIRTQRLPTCFNSPRGVVYDRSRPLEDSPVVDGDSSASSSFNQVIPNSDCEMETRKILRSTHSGQQQIKFNNPERSLGFKAVDRTMDRCDNSGRTEPSALGSKNQVPHTLADFEDLDEQAINEIHELDGSLNLADSPNISHGFNKSSVINPPFPSSPNDDFPELDQDALIALAELETQSAKPAVACENSSSKSPVTPGALTAHNPRAKKSSLTSLPYEDHSPLLFRSLPKNKSQIGLGEYENGDNFLDPSTVLIGTQMPRNRRAQRPIFCGDAKTVSSKKKRIIADESEDEDNGRNQLDSRCEPKYNSNRAMKRDIEDSNLPVKPKAKQKQACHSKRGNGWALKTGLFDLEAAESDTSISDEDGQPKKKRKKKRRNGKKRRLSSEEEIESENSVDRDFLVNTSSSNIQDNCSPDKSMSSFYRASILMMSQPLSVVKKKLQDPSVELHQSNWNRNPFNRHQVPSTSNHHHHHQPSDNRLSSSNNDDDHFSYDSFCVPDEATIEYEDNPDETLSSQL